MKRREKNNMKKRIARFIFPIFALALSLNLGLTPVNVSAKTTSKNWWYKKVIKKKTWTYSVKKFHAYSSKSEKITVRKKDFYEYTLLDINKDGIKEMFLRGGDVYFPNILVLTYYKKKVKPLYVFGGVRGMYYKGKTITYVNGTSSENTAWAFKLKKGKLKEVFNGFHTTSSVYPVPIYQINDKNVSRNKFYKKYNKYMENSKSLDSEFVPID